MPLPFEVTLEELKGDLDRYVDEVFGALQSEFMTLPRGKGFVEYAKKGAAPRFEVIACIAGRGFKVRREDMKKLLLATRGKVFAMSNLDRLIDCTRLADFRTR